MRKSAFVFLCLLGLILCRIGSKSESHSKVAKQSNTLNYNSLRVFGGNSGGGGTPVTQPGVYGSLDVTNDTSKVPTPTPPTPMPKPSAPVKCPTLFTKCDFQGSYFELCGTINDFDVKSIHSVWLPDGASVTLYGSKDFAGKSVSFKTSNRCFDNLFA